MSSMLDNAYGDDTLEELSATVIMMTRIQPADAKANVEPKYDVEAISEVNALQINLISGMLSKSVYEHMNHEKLKTIINTSNDDQIDSNIIFDDPYVENNGGIDEHDSNDHDQSFDIESLAYNVQREAENQQRMNNLPRPRMSSNFSSSVSVVSNKRETLNSIVCQSNASVLKAKTVNAINDASNLVCVSCGKDVFMISHDKCVARYASFADSRVKRALFTSPVAAKSRNLGATSVVAKSKFSVAKTPTTTNELVLWIVDSGCSKHMTGNLKLLRNFVEKFMGTVRFGNDNFAIITEYGDCVQGNLTICHVYYVEGLGHNFFSVGKICDGDLEVAFHSNTFYVWNLEGEDLLTSSCHSNLYTISIFDLAASSLVFLMSKATSTKSLLWHRRLSHFNFGTINQLTKKDLVDGLLKFKYDKDHLCSACEQGKSKKATFLLIVL
ncbi:integrase, catalytic region, zinc finger, CCHC-type containing protein [Tanacetum coccineum]